MKILKLYRNRKPTSPISIFTRRTLNLFIFVHEIKKSIFRIFFTENMKTTPETNRFGGCFYSNYFSIYLHSDRIQKKPTLRYIFTDRIARYDVNSLHSSNFPFEFHADKIQKPIAILLWVFWLPLTDSN